MHGSRATPEQLADDLREIATLLRRRVRAAREAETLPFAQISVLKRLEADGAATTADLARAEAMTAQSMGAIVAALEASGYVSRRDDPDHGRRRLVSTTAAGRRALAANREARVGWTAGVLATRLDPSERRTVAAAVSLLRRAFDTQGDDR